MLVLVIVIQIIQGSITSTSTNGIPIFAGLLAGHKGGAAINSNPLMDLVNLSPAEQACRGLAYTPGEILQQPELWMDTATRTAACLAEIEMELTSFLADPAARIVLTGPPGRDPQDRSAMAHEYARSYATLAYTSESGSLLPFPLRPVCGVKKLRQSTDCSPPSNPPPPHTHAYATAVC